MTRNKQWCPAMIPALLVMLLGLSGCVAAAAVGAAAGAGVAGTTIYENGKETEIQHASIDRTWTATRTTIKQMGLQVEKENKAADGYTVDAKRPDGTPVTVTGEPDGRNTRVTVRVGTMGDRQASEDIQRRIASHLG